MNTARILWREWTAVERTASAARAAHLFMNMHPCPDCGLPWPEGYVHESCPGPKPDPVVDGVIATIVAFGQHDTPEDRRLLAEAIVRQLRPEGQ